MEQPQVVLSPEQEQSLHTVSTISYLLHLIVAVGAVLPGFQPGVLLLLIAVVLDLVKRGDAQGSWQESHFRFRLRSVLLAGLAYLLTAPLWVLLLVPGWIAWFIVSLWFLYRIVQGWSALSGRRAIPD
ncbi:DUF4870 family protein [Inhella crocodyli]|jgi:uncharacterized membrane protein|uniref:Transmembrane protein n=1 Tax=Inhella crocodyli TaxID=2499851 RepID=A0A3S2WL20_9BURK|nr:hypothetical protein [Inhella crocodyli]RVT82371.1 hypothetical protein EOD73_16675 [Inhella crocodyli]